MVLAAAIDESRLREYTKNGMLLIPGLSIDAAIHK